MRNILNKPTLVLNKGYLVINVTTLGKALKKISSERFNILDENYIKYTWESWADEYSFPHDYEDDRFSDYIDIGSKKMVAPEVVLCTEYDRKPTKSVPLNRRNVYLRDKGICQYTGEYVSPKEFTWDHIIPRDYGGVDSWENLVVCKESVNHQKANRTPEEAGLKLIRKPKRPTWNPLFEIGESIRPESWRNFIKKENWEMCYWDIELGE